MRHLLILFMIAISLTGVAQDFTPNAEGVTEFYIDSISLQQGCDDCEKNYRLYDGVRHTFFGGEVIGMKEFRRVASLIGAAVGIEYDRSASDNIRILHAVLSGEQYRSILATTGRIDTTTTVVVVDTVKKSIKFNSIEHMYVGEITDISNGVVLPIDIPTMDIARLYNGSIPDSIELLPSYGEYELLSEVNDRWNTCSRSIDLRKSRYAISMAKKYGGYKEGPVGYEDGWFNIQRKQDKFCTKEGDKIPFLGFSEGEYKRYYRWRAPTKSVTSRKRNRPNRISMNRVSGKTRRVSVAASHRACRRG